MQRLFEEIKFFEGKTRASKHQVQRLCGILAHCAKLVKGGRTFSQRVINLLKSWRSGQKRIRLSMEFNHDLSWWKKFASSFNGKRLMVKYNHGQGPTFFTDSCLSGYGFWLDNDWQAGYFDASITPDLSFIEPSHSHWVNVEDDGSSPNINVLELVPVWLCLKRHFHSWRDLHILCRTDNRNVQYMINKGCSSNKLCMAILRDIFWICASEIHLYIHLSALHIAGRENVIADILSRVCFSNDLSVLNKYGLCCCSSYSSGYG